MATITITFEDTPDGGAFISSDPSLDELLAKTDTPESITTAECCAMQCWLLLRREGDEQPAGPAH